MNQMTAAWRAFRNMLRAAARDPLWAIIALVSAPFLLWRPVLGAAGIILLVLLVVGVGGEFALGQLGFQQGSWQTIALGVSAMAMSAKGSNHRPCETR